MARIASWLLLTSALMAPVPASAADTARDAAWAERLGWGPSAASDTGPAPGSDAWLRHQLDDRLDPLPPAVQAQIDAMRISKERVAALVVETDAMQRDLKAITDPDQKKAAREAYQKAMNGLADEARQRFVLRALYSPDQLRERMTWFWFNHFNVQAGKRDIRAMVGDYEETIRAHALGRYRDLLEATLRHPAMLRYLDNDQNAKGKINENYAREIMELHSMGVGSGYTQADVQELARILTGVGVDQKPDAPKLKPELQPLYIRAGLFEFNPARHDFGTKHFLGHTIQGSGFGEVEQALDLIAESPATAHHVSLKLATYFMGDHPPPALVDRMAATFRKTHGDIAELLKTMIRAREFSGSLGSGFKDPVGYTLSAVRLAYGNRAVTNPQPVVGWIRQMGEGLYDHETPDGYDLSSAAWSAPGQMATRFDIARQLGNGAARLFQPADAAPGTPPPPAPVPMLKDSPILTARMPTLGKPTLTALGQARSPAEWNALYFSSPEFMHR
ncbi:DUF1800 domain-containing protein [Sphingomonas sanguinis]|uniref:DUF1800 domain-containing protein n=1 Tax=Sphingomonas sanguinis TaxID=33051 RepID=A0ABU5LMM1_9SPHN|nr:DUF1800 domain-containing protein [Sphingomonas sanguinis]MDZ7281180.1 DUF1800 domain-containing protein [Sphingomonas sanguinis]